MTNLLLAVESGGQTAEGGGLSAATIAVIVLLVALAAFGVAYVVVGPGRGKKPRTRGDIPLAMRPYHSDEELETTGLERAMSWGVALALFIAVFFPLYWVLEPDRIESKDDEFYNEDVALGRELYAANCTNCHGEDAEGGLAPHPDPNVEAAWPAPDLTNIAARYTESDIVLDVEEFIETTLFQGRPGTPMPAWGSAYQGPMNDQQIEAITAYILAIQDGELTEARAFSEASGEELFTANCARCHGYDARGRVGPNLRIVFDEFGATDGDPASVTEARESIEYILKNGLYVPTGAIMPNFDGILTDGAITRIIDYLESIQVPADEAGPTAGIGMQGTWPGDDGLVEEPVEGSDLDVQGGSQELEPGELDGGEQ